MIQKVFNRYEKKYLLDQKTYEVFKKELDVYMAEDSTYFFEIKKKYNGLVNKRRIPLSREEAKKYLEEGDAPKETGQIYREVDYFLPIMGSDQSAISLMTGWQCLERTTRISALPLMWRSAAAPII